MNALQSISVQNLPVVYWQNQAVITSELLANVYETDVKNIQMNFKRNAERFIEGQHFFKITGEELKDLKNQPTNIGLVQIAKNAAHLILWTERGTVRHAKMLGTDKAWEVQDQLEQFYFSQKAEPQLSSNPLQLTLADIEKLIDQKLKSHPLLERPDNNLGYRVHPPFNNQVRVVMDWVITDVNEQFAAQGYRLTKI